MSSNTAEDRLFLPRHPDLRRYLAARFLVGMATQIQTVAVGWQVFSVSGDPFGLGSSRSRSSCPSSCSSCLPAMSRTDTIEGAFNC